MSAGRPDGLLPWCGRLRRPYYEVNLILIATRDGWREQQTGLEMREIIPMIDALLDQLGPDYDPARGPFLYPSWLVGPHVV